MIKLVPRSEDFEPSLEDSVYWSAESYVLCYTYDALEYMNKIWDLVWIHAKN